MIRLFNHYLSARTLLLTAIEMVVLFQSMVLGYQLRLAEYAMRLPVSEAALFTVVMVLMMTSLGLYQVRAEPFRTTVQRLLVAYVLTLVLMSVVFYLLPMFYVGRGVFAVSSLFAMGGVLLVRLMFFRVTDLGLPRRRVLVLGHGAEAEDLIRYLHADDQVRAIEYAGTYPVSGEREFGEPPRRASHEHLLRTVRELRVSEIVIAARERRGGVLPLRQLLDARLSGVRVMDLAAFYERERGILKIDNLRASWLIFGQGFDHGVTRDVIKRTFDVFVSLLLLVLTLPLIVIAMLLIALESGWPVLYRQERVGQGGKPFTIYKLRTMRHDAEGDGQPRWASPDDGRITRVGRLLRVTRIDELPQLFNVLRGDMSFVGPRPERPFFVRRLTGEIPFYDLRHSVKPGITGWSQVRYAYGASVEDARAKLQYDLYYVKNHSLFLDLLILVETAQVVMLGKGAR